MKKMRDMKLSELRELNLNDIDSENPLCQLKQTLISAGLVRKKDLEPINNVARTPYPKPLFPLTIVFDTSKSQEDYRDQMEQALKSFINSALNSNYTQDLLDLCVIAFGEKVDVVRPFDLIRDEDLELTLHDFGYGNATCFESALAVALLLQEARHIHYATMRRNRQRGIILFISDFGNNDMLTFQGEPLYKTLKPWMNALTSSNNGKPKVSLMKCVFPSYDQLDNESKAWCDFYGGVQADSQNFIEQMEKTFASLHDSIVDLAKGMEPDFDALTDQETSDYFDSNSAHSRVSSDYSTVNSSSWD